MYPLWAVVISKRTNTLSHWKTLDWLIISRWERKCANTKCLHNITSKAPLRQMGATERGINSKSKPGLEHVLCFDFPNYCRIALHKMKDKNQRRSSPVWVFPVLINTRTKSKRAHDAKGQTQTATPSEPISKWERKCVCFLLVHKFTISANCS